MANTAIMTAGNPLVNGLFLTVTVWPQQAKHSVYIRNTGVKRFSMTSCIALKINAGLDILCNMIKPNRHQHCHWTLQTYWA